MEFTQYNCPVCKKQFEKGDDIVVCPECGAPHHRECYEQNGKCFFDRFFKCTPPSLPFNNALVYYTIFSPPSKEKSAIFLPHHLYFSDCRDTIRTTLFYKVEQSREPCVKCPWDGELPAGRKCSPALRYGPRIPLSARAAFASGMQNEISVIQEVFFYENASP